MAVTALNCPMNLPTSISHLRIDLQTGICSNWSMTLQEDALKLAELDQQICRTIISGNINELGRLLKKYVRLRDSLKLEMLGKPVISTENSKTSKAFRKIIGSDGLPSDIVVEQVLKLDGNDSSAEVFDEFEFDELGSNLLYSWFSHYEYVSALAKMRPMILQCDPSESVRRLARILHESAD